MTILDRPLLIHVAAASESRGRVVLAARSSTPHPVAVDAALTLARAFDAAVEGLLIACPNVVALTGHAFAREVRHGGRIAPLMPSTVSDHQEADTARARITLSKAAAQAAVVFTSGVVRDGLVEALGKACALQGPWNIMALAEPLQPADAAVLPVLLDDVAGATALVCVGPQASAGKRAPIVVVVEETGRLPHMVRAADRLVLTEPDARAHTIALLLVGRSRDHTTEIEAHVRRLLPDGVSESDVPVVIADASAPHGTTVEVAEAVRRLNGGWVIARGGGVAVPANADIAALLGVLRCPLLLVR